MKCGILDFWTPLMVNLDLGRLMLTIQAMCYKVDNLSSILTWWGLHWPNKIFNPFYDPILQPVLLNSQFTNQYGMCFYVAMSCFWLHHHVFGNAVMFLATASCFSYLISSWLCPWKPTESSFCSHHSEALQTSVYSWLGWAKHDHKD